MVSVCTGEKLKVQEKGGFFRKNLFVILAFLLPFAIMGAVFAARRFFPFGNGMIMVTDSWHQYYPFLVEYQRMLKEGASLMYSWNTGGGSNFLGVIGNYLGSPLYLLSYFVPSGTPWLQAFLALTVMIRVGCAGGFSAIFFRKVFKRNDLSLVYFSLMYALCAFVLGYYWNMMWLDTVALLPLVSAGVISVLRDKKFSLYIISLAMSVTFSFYMGYMVCLFVLILCICYTIVSFVSFKESFKNAGKMLVYTLVAFMLTAFVTIPVFMALQSSDSASDVGGFPLSFSVNYGFGYNGESTLKNALVATLRTATNLLSFTRPIKVNTGNPNIACGALSLVLAVFYFTTGKIKIKEKIVSGSVLVFFVLSCVLGQLNYIWHGMNTPAMVYYRWTYIFSFVLVVMAYRAFTLIDSFSKKSFIFASAALVLYLGAAFLVQRRLSVAITAAAVVVIVAGLALYRAGKIKYRMLSLALCLFVICEMGLSAYYGVMVVGKSENDDYPQDYAQVMELLGATDHGDEMYRTEFLSTYTLNDGDLYDAYGITTFNSMVNSNYADFLAEAGLASSKINNRYEYLESTPVINTLLNIKYLVARDNEKAVDSNYLKVVATTDECTLYENTSYIPMGYMTDKSLLQWQLHDDTQVPIDSQNQLFSLLTGVDEDVLEYVESTDGLECEYPEYITENKKIKNIYSLKFKKIAATDDEAAIPLTAEYKLPADGSYYGLFSTSTDEPVTVEVNADSDNAVELNERWMYVAALGDYSEGDSLKVTMTADAGKNGVAVNYLVRLREDVFARGMESLRNRSTMSVTRWSDRGFTADIEVAQEGLFFTTVLYDDGFEAFVDGKKVEITPVADTFVAFDLTEGKHTIELKYTSPGFYAGVAVTVLGIVLFVLVGVITMLYRKKHPTVTEDKCKCILSDETSGDTVSDDNSSSEKESDILSESEEKTESPK